MATKQCSKCGIEKPLEDFHRMSRSKDGRKSLCKPCNCADHSEYQKKNWHLVYPKKKIYASMNREALRRNSKRWSERNPGVAHARQVAKHGAQKVAARSRQWAAKNRERSRQLKQAWKTSNPSAVAELTARRRAALRRAVPGWADMNAVKEIYRKARETDGMHVDHIVPIISRIVCGLHWEANLQVITAFENYSKNNRSWPDMP